MRSFNLLVLIFLFSNPVFSTENIDFNFQGKSYQFQLKDKGNLSELGWKKNGFEFKNKRKLQECWKKEVEKEILKIRKYLSTANKQKVLGTKISLIWNGREINRSLLPKEMDLLDKRFTHLFNLHKNGEGKCIK